MLKFRLAATTVPGPFIRSSNRWTSGPTWIGPFRHPTIEQVAITDGLSTLIAVRERVPNSGQSTGDPQAGPRLLTADAYEQDKLKVLHWPLEHLAVEQIPDGSFRIHAGQWGTAPVYVVESGGHLHGSWSFVDLKPYIAIERICDVEVARLLSYRKRYSRETLFENVVQLTERSSALYATTGDLRLTYPTAATEAHPREIHEDVDITEVYERELQRAISQRHYNPKESAVELSAGMDSTNVAMSLAAMHQGDVLAYALMFGGPAGEQQARRRAEMLRFTGFRDLQLKALDWAPFSPRGKRVNDILLDPFAEPYHEAVDQIIAAAAKRGVNTVFTGDGGDELVSPRGKEWATLGKVRGRYNPNREPASWLTDRTRELLPRIDENLAPASVINEASLLGFACRSPQFMDAGLWPISPLCSPRLIRFAEQLPIEWRSGKRICRERLTRLGFSKDVVYPQLRENFTHVMEYGIRRYGLDLLTKLLPESVLVELGYVDPQQLVATRDRVGSTGHVETSLYAFLHLELTLRGLFG